MLDTTPHFKIGAFRFCFVVTGIAYQCRMKTFKDTPTTTLRFLPTYRLATFQSYRGRWELLRIHAQLVATVYTTMPFDSVKTRLQAFDGNRRLSKLAGLLPFA
ncbi:hypothetical protein N7509_004104 [Penicillium cosmopolitanum]|uniref:Uncharacterized protein n=1 Tax=Penicillium cosmopolitanum TaxID=1131564 RepID=A0A9X0BC38_9EURO|nr:uncharacterized protein N7509_004104 [Penicillium cosmopolitanum]KAJ5404233.1 hypothetical protein N7509_004104 [Penicillium cosmopolitanum]